MICSSEQSGGCELPPAITPIQSTHNIPASESKKSLISEILIIDEPEPEGTFELQPRRDSNRIGVLQEPNFEAMIDIDDEEILMMEQPKHMDEPINLKSDKIIL